MMWSRLLMTALAWTVTSAGRSADYSGARMPYYHEDYETRDSLTRDEYPDRSPDAPVPLDYKYVEDADGKYNREPENVADEKESWPKDTRKNTEAIDAEDDYSQDLVKYSKANDRRRKSKSRFVQVRRRASSKRNMADVEEETLLSRGRRTFGHVRDRPLGNDLQSWDGRVQTNRNMEMRSRNNDIRNVGGLGRGSGKIGRRKARDRAAAITTPDTNGMFEADRTLEADDENSDDEPVSLQARRAMERGPADPDFVPNPDQIRIKDFQTYEDYYDLKRAFNIKNNLASISGRPTKASIVPEPPTRPSEEWFRRANIPDASVGLQRDRSASTSSSPKGKSSTPMAIAKLTNTKPAPTTKVTTVPSPARNATELSLAEKSRLSILKKAQRKESYRSGPGTSKPPVLMQVTNRLQTVVMVEPPGSKIQRMQAREVFDESPERTARARRLMRHKLLANAKDIHDLTNNWDELVCDYIDVSLLSGAPRLRPVLVLLLPIIYPIYVVSGMIINYSK